MTKKKLGYGKCKFSTESEMLDFASELVMMRHKAGVLGLWKTMHALDAATKAVGYEIAELIEKVKP